MNSDVFFQMLLYYHSYFDILYGLMLVPSGIYKIGLGIKNEISEMRRSKNRSGSLAPDSPRMTRDHSPNERVYH